MALPNLMSTGVASTDLGLGGLLTDQVGSETAEQRKKRMAQMQQDKLGITQSPASSAMALFGGAGAPR